MSESIYHGKPGAHGRGGDGPMTPDVSHVSNPEVRHEVSDVDVWAIGKFILALAIGTAVVFGIVAGLFKILGYVMRQPPPSSVALKGAERLPPEPRLQGLPGQQAEGVNLELKEPQSEYVVVREKWEHQLNGDPDPQTGARAVPIEQAKQQLLRQGLPARQQADDKQLMRGVDIPEFPSSGQVYEKRDH